jgi:riboflavin synthase
VFTGIVEELGEVKSLGSGKMSIHAHLILDGLKIGDSIAVNGICLTVVAFNQDGFAADVMPETMRRTSFAALKKGSRVNLERALTLNSRLGGHIVSGHIDGVGTIASLQEEANAIIFKIEASSQLLRYIIEKGSVALDGISLTVVEVTKHAFSVSIIPHTCAGTSLGYKKAGDKINIENDIIGKYVERFLLQPADTTGEIKPELTREFLIKYGF